MATFKLFPAQEPDEKIILSMHRHWFVLLGKLGSFIGLALGPAIVWIIGHSLAGWPLQSNSSGFGIAVVVASLYYLFIWIVLFGFWLDYYLDYFLVTDRRVVDIEQSGLFNRSIAELRLYRIQDVTSEVKGFWPTILRFGNVYIQTAGTEERFVFEQVAHPELVVKQLLVLTDKIDDKIEHPAEPATPAAPVVRGTIPPDALPTTPAQTPVKKNTTATTTTVVPPSELKQ